MDYTKIPHVLNLNRVKRAYIGGALLDQWQGLENPSDSNWSEEFLISTVEVTNEQKAAQEGLSTTDLPDGQRVTLSELIARDYNGYLGSRYAAEKTCVFLPGWAIPPYATSYSAIPTRSSPAKSFIFPMGKRRLGILWPPDRWMAASLVCMLASSPA